MKLQDLLQWEISDQLITSLGKEAGIEDPEKSKGLTDALLNVFVGSMAKNSKSDTGLSSLFNALSNDHDGGLLDDIAGMVLGGNKKSKANDGAGIIGHLLGNNQSMVIAALASAFGLKKNNVLNMAIKLAPIVLAVVGRAKAKQNMNEGQLSDFIKGAFGNEKNNDTKKKQGLIEKLIDSDDDGSVVDDLGKIGWNMFKSMSK